MPTGYENAFELIAREQLQALFVARNPWNHSNRRSITQFALLAEAQFFTGALNVKRIALFRDGGSGLP